MFLNIIIDFFSGFVYLLLHVRSLIHRISFAR